MRTSEKPEGKGSDKTHGLTLFLVDLRQVRAEEPDTLKVVKVRTMFNYATNQIFCQGMRVPASAVIGDVGKGGRPALRRRRALRGRGQHGQTPRVGWPHRV
jgi:acyl-CoA dehydrogenase